MSALVLSLDPRVEDRLISEIVRSGHTVVARVETAAEIIAVVESGQVDGALVSAARSRLTEGTLAACDDRGVRLVALAAGELQRRHAASVGVFEVLDDETLWEDVERMLDLGVRVAPRGPAEPAARRGRVIAVWGPAGAPGRSTVAANVAAELAASGRSVALLDADSYGGTIAPALGLLDEAPGFAAACRLAATDSLTEGELERIAARYASPHGSFWVLTGIGRPTRWTELSADRVTKTIAACASWVEDVVIDTGFSLESDEEISSDLFAPRRNAATIAALRAADHVVAVGLADPVGISRFLRVHVDLREIVPDTRVSVVMNRVRSSAVGMDARGQVAMTLSRFAGIEATALLPEDRNGVDTAVLTGRTLRDAAAKSPLRAAVMRFLDAALLPEPQAVPDRRPRLRPRRRVVAL